MKFHRVLAAGSSGVAVESQNSHFRRLVRLQIAGLAVALFVLFSVDRYSEIGQLALSPYLKVGRYIAVGLIAAAARTSVVVKGVGVGELWEMTITRIDFDYALK
jgi:hypothetical protein